MNEVNIRIYKNERNNLVVDITPNPNDIMDSEVKSMAIMMEKVLARQTDMTNTFRGSLNKTPSLKLTYG